MAAELGIRARGLLKTYGETVALDRVDLDVPRAQVHGLVGPNGAGKTTLLGMLLGLSAPDEGDLEILGAAVRGTFGGPAGVAGFLDSAGLYPSLTARQNLASLARLHGPQAADIDDLLAEVGLTDVAGDRVRGFSLGMRQRLGLAAALLGRPRLLILDEPTNGLDPAGRRHVHRLLRRLADDGATVVISSHQMVDLASLCDEVTLLSTGRLVFTGPVAKLAAESGPVEHRIVSTDLMVATRVAESTPGIRVVGGADDALVVSGGQPAIDGLVVHLAGEGVAIRELGPLVPPLEAAFLALTAPESAR